MNFSEIAVLAQKSGYDMITVVAMGPQTIVTCVRRMSSQAPRNIVLDRSFWDIEKTALDELAQAGLDVRFTDNGVIRAYGKQNSSLGAICDAPHVPKTVPVGEVATTFQPQGIHRKDFNVEPDLPKKPKYQYYPIY